MRYDRWMYVLVIALSTCDQVAAGIVRRKSRQLLPTLRGIDNRRNLQSGARPKPPTSPPPTSPPSSASMVSIPVETSAPSISISTNIPISQGGRPKPPELLPTQPPIPMTSKSQTSKSQMSKSQTSSPSDPIPVTGLPVDTPAPSGTSTTQSPAPTPTPSMTVTTATPGTPTPAPVTPAPTTAATTATPGTPTPAPVTPAPTTAVTTATPGSTTPAPATPAPTTTVTTATPGTTTAAPVTPAPTTTVTTATPGTTTPAPVTPAPTTTVTTAIPGTTTPAPVTPAPTTTVTTATPGIPTQVPSKATTTTATPSTATPSTAAPSTAAPTTSAPSTSAPSTATPTTIRPSPATSAPSTAAPTTSAPSTAPPTTIRPTAGGTTSPPTTRAPTCADNSKNYTVLIDLQIQYPADQIVSCGGQDSVINLNIASVLNEAFPTTVPDWDGDATFGTFVFDPTQAVSNVGPIGRQRRQLTDTTTMEITTTTAAATTTSTNRRLQQGSCSSRADVACEGDLCRWGCVAAATTDCGTSSLTNWVLLADDVLERLVSLNLACLGIADQLEVVLLVVDPEVGTGRSFRSGQNANDVLLGSEGEGDLRDDSPTRTIQVKSKMEFRFFNGADTAPQEQDVTGLVAKIEDFFFDQFSLDPNFAESVVGFDVVNPSVSSSPDFALDFIGNIVLDVDSQQTVKEAAYAMSTYDMDEFLIDYALIAEPLGQNQFSDTEWVSFTSSYGSHNR